MCITLDNRSGKFGVKSIKNQQLRDYANMLADDAMNIRANLLHMSAIMATIAAKRDEGILEEFDNSIVTFAEKRLGIKKSQVYSMVQVGATFLSESGASLLTEKGGKWNNTQFMALLPMSGTGKEKKSPEETLEACEQLVADGKIKPSMTVAEIKEVVKTNRPDAKKLEVRKAKAEAKKKEKAEAEEKANAKIKGTLVGKIEFFQFEDGSLNAAINGEVITFNESNVQKIVETLVKCKNFKKSA